MNEDRIDQVDRLLTAKELGAYLSRPVATLYAWRYRGLGPPAIRVGRELRFLEEDVQRWLDTLRETPHEAPGRGTKLASAGSKGRNR